MADVKISALPTGSALSGTEIIPVVQGGDTVKTTTGQIKELVVGSGENMLVDKEYVDAKDAQLGADLNNVNYKNDLFTYTDGTFYRLIMRRVEKGVTGVAFAVHAYSANVYFNAYDSNGTEIISYQLTGGTNTSTEKIVNFGNDIAYYSILTLNTDLSTSYIKEIISAAYYNSISRQNYYDLRSNLSLIISPFIKNRTRIAYTIDNLILQKNGFTVSNVTYSVTDKISINPQKRYFFSTYNNVLDPTYAYVCYYDINNNCIGYLNSDQILMSNYFNSTCVIPLNYPKNTVYIRACEKTTYKGFVLSGLFECDMAFNSQVFEDIEIGDSYVDLTTKINAIYSGGVGYILTKYGQNQSSTFYEISDNIVIDHTKKYAMTVTEEITSDYCYIAVCDANNNIISSINGGLGLKGKTINLKFSKIAYSFKVVSKISNPVILYISSAQSINDSLDRLLYTSEDFASRGNLRLQSLTDKFADTSVITDASKKAFSYVNRLRIIVKDSLASQIKASLIIQSGRILIRLLYNSVNYDYPFQFSTFGTKFNGVLTNADSGAAYNYNTFGLIAFDIEYDFTDYDGTQYWLEGQYLKVLSFTQSGYKKAIWLGTSIPAGMKYPSVSCYNNGIICLNLSVGSSGITTTQSVIDKTYSAPSYNDNLGKSLSETIAEKESYCSALLSAGSMTEAQMEVIRNYSYERKIIPLIDGTVDDINIVILDHGYNDRAVMLSNSEQLDTFDLSTRSRTTFCGAFNYIIDAIKTKKHYERVGVIGYFENQTENNALTSNGKSVCSVQEKLAKYWMFPICKTWECSSFSQEHIAGTSTFISDYNTLYGTSYIPYDVDVNGNITARQLYCPDYVHPHTDMSGESAKVLNTITSEYMEKIDKLYL